MIKAIALDDEPLALDVLRVFCEQFAQIDLVQAFTNPVAAEQFISREEENIDIIFLDIQMPSISGLDFSKKLSNTLIIFTTAFPEHAVEGFNLNAVDYLLKPFTYERFVQSVEKAERLMVLRNQSDSGHLVVRADYATHKLLLSDIQLIQGMDNYLKITMRNQKPVVVRMSMKAMVDELPGDSFVRVHRSYIVPLREIISLKGKFVILRNREEIPIGNLYSEEVSKRFFGI